MSLSRQWRKSPQSNSSGNCLYARLGADGGVELAETDPPGGGAPVVLTTSAASWRAFIEAAKAGEFDLLNGSEIPAPA